MVKLFAGGADMKSTKNCSGTAKNTKSKNTKSTNCSSSSKKNCKNSKSSTESDSDPSGSYTGNPVGWGKYAIPVQDADDL